MTSPASQGARTQGTRAQGARVARNTALIFASRVCFLAVTFGLSLAVAWKLGDEALGDYGLMIAYWFVSQQAAALGLSYLLPREIAQARDRCRPLVLAGIAIAVPAAALFGLGLLGLTALLDYDPLRRSLVGWVAVALVPGAISQVGEATFLAQERGNALAAVQTLEHGLRGLISLAALGLGADLVGLAHILVGTRLLGVLATLALLRGHLPGGGPGELGAAALRLARQIPLYAALYAAAAVFLRIDVVMLSVLSEKEQLGAYIAAFRLYDAAAVVPATAALVLFPVLARLWAEGRGAEATLATRSLTTVWIAVLPVALGLALGAHGIIDFFYSDEFRDAAPVLAVLGLALLPGSVETLLGHTMVAVVREAVNLLMVIAAAAVAVVGHLLLVPEHGALGAAGATLAATVFLAVVNAAYVHRKMFRVRFGPELLRALPGAAAAAAFLAVFGHRGPWWTLPGAAAIYGALAYACGAVRPDTLRELVGSRRPRDPG